jgi:ribosomal protein S18 acetylase RimI-like enzyme
MDKDLRFKPAVIGDRDTLLQLVQRYYAFDHIPFAEEEVRAALGVLLQDDRLGRAWILLNGDQVAGYVVLSFHFDHELGGRSGIVTDLYIEPEHRHRGLGTEALCFIEEQAARFGLLAIELQVERNNVIARRLYEKSGYRPFDRIPMAKRLRG